MSAALDCFAAFVAAVGVVAIAAGSVLVGLGAVAGAVLMVAWSE